MRYLKVVFLALFFVVSMLFFFQNTTVLNQSVSFELSVLDSGFHSIPLPFYLVILCAFLLGALVAVVYLFLDKLRSMKLLKEAQARIAALEREIGAGTRTDEQPGGTAANG